jgi:hypothetical protein
MTNNFQKPSSLALCIFSALWAIVAVWCGVSFALAGKFISAAIMGLFGCAALGLWFQSGWQQVHSSSLRVLEFSLRS